MVGYGECLENREGGLSIGEIGLLSHNPVLIGETFYVNTQAT